MKPNLSIVINKFGPIENQTIDFYPFMLFTGNSNMGKSYANYLFYYVTRFFSSIMSSAIFERKMKINGTECTVLIDDNDIRKALVNGVNSFISDFLGDKGLECDVNFLFELPLYNGKRNLIVKCQKDDSFVDNGIIRYNVSINEVNDFGFYFSADKDFFRCVISKYVNDYLQKVFFGATFIKAVILPPARGSFVGESFGVKNQIAHQAGMYRQFLLDYDWAVNGSGSLNDAKDSDKQFFLSRIQTLVKGKLITEEGREKLQLTDGKIIPLSAAASSIKELSPLLYYLKNWSNYKLSFCLEEPEAHLHPSMQMDIADLIAACRNKGLMFQMTTHSDYFIQRVNQLLRIGKMKADDATKYEQYKKQFGLNRRFYLNKDEVACYYFHSRSSDENKVTIEKIEFGDDDTILMKSFYPTVTVMTKFDNGLDLFEERYGNDNKE